MKLPVIGIPVIYCDRVYIFPPGAGKCFLFTEVFFAKDRVPVGTRSVEKETEVNKKHLPGPRVGRYLPLWRAEHSNPRIIL